MKKIVLMIVAVLGIIFIVPDAFAYLTGTDVTDYIDFPEIYLQEDYYITHRVRYGTASTQLLDFTFLFDTEGDVYVKVEQGLLTSGYHLIDVPYDMYFYEYSLFYFTINTDIDYLVLQDLYFVLFDESYFEYGEDFIIPIVGFDSTWNLTDFGTRVLNIEQYIEIDFNFDLLNAIYDHAFYDGSQVNNQGAYADGYNEAKEHYGHYDGTNYIPANQYGLELYNMGLDENRGYFGKFYEGNWLTAEQYGNIRYYQGYDLGITGEIDWFEWSTTFFLMPFRIMNIEVLPGIKIGYFALFSLLIGVVGWFFFIVGKGGGRKK